MKTIDIEIHPDGDVRVEASGFQGKACELATAEILKALGGEVIRKEVKAEMKATQKQNLSQGLGRG